MWIGLCAFTEDEPTRLICDLAPDILVKGGDNVVTEIPGGDCVREAGGRGDGVDLCRWYFYYKNN